MRIERWIYDPLKKGKDVKELFGRKHSSKTCNHGGKARDTVPLNHLAVSRLKSNSHILHLYLQNNCVLH